MLQAVIHMMNVPPGSQFELTRQDGQEEVLHDADDRLPPLDVFVGHAVISDDGLQCGAHSADLLSLRRLNLRQHRLLLLFLQGGRTISTKNCLSCAGACVHSSNNMHQAAVPHPGPPPVPFVPDVSEGVRDRLQQNITKVTGVNSSWVALGSLRQGKINQSNHLELKT